MHFKRLISRSVLLAVTLPIGLMLWSAPAFAQAAGGRTIGSLVSASQTSVALNLRNVTLAEALDRLVERGAPLIYSSELVRNAGRVSCEKCENLPSREILARLLNGTGIGFRELPGGELLLSRTAAKRTIEATVRGRVVEAVSGNGIERAIVTIVGTNLRALTGSTGTFAIPGVASGSRTLRVNRLGYSQAERVIVVPETGAIDVPVIAMDRIAAQLNPLEIKVSTGSIADTERKKLSNAIVVISSEEIQLSGARDLPEVLRARAPGVNVARNGGANGVGGTIQIRGVSSIIQDQSPLIYVDGVPVDGGASALNGRGSHAFSGPDKNIGSQLRIDELTLDQIERIEIIKGPAATTLYGTQGSNGVIQIFTKRGVPGETRITVSSEMGTSRLKTADDFGVDLPYRDQFLSQFRTPRVQEHHVGVSGGAGDITYSLGAAFAKDDGYIPKNGETRSSLTTSFRTSPTKQLSVQLSGSMVRRNFDLSTLYLGSNRTTVEQALRTITRTETEVDRLYGSLALSYQPNSIWQNRLTIGTDDNNEVNERLSQAAATGVTRDRVSREFRRTSGNFVSTLSYPQTGRFTSTLSVGGEAFHDVIDRLRLRGQGLPNFDVTDFDLASTILGGDQGLPTDLSSKVAQIGGFLQEQIGID
nr:TonB-dependent receptor plug domain-containing protein [Planctomycetota bacterium]